MGTEIRDIRESDVSVRPLYDMAAKQEHDLWLPTHIIEKDGEMAGSVGMGAIPFCTIFVSDEVNSPFALRSVAKGIDDQMRDWGDRSYFLCVGPRSPAHRLMPSGGYAGFNTTIWYKELK
jgi:hypothetical protein